MMQRHNLGLAGSAPGGGLIHEPPGEPPPLPPPPHVVHGQVPPPVPVPEPPPVAETHIENVKPWTAQQHAAYSRMYTQIHAGLAAYYQRTANAGRLLTLGDQLARRISVQLENAAWLAWETGMTRALELSGDVISPALVQRDRGLRPGYNAAIGAAVKALTEWQHWMELAAAGHEAIMGPVRHAYDQQMEAAYTDMQQVNADAEQSWRRMYDGAERAGTLLTSFKARAGQPSPA